MLKKYAKTLIIALFYLVILAVIFTLIANQLIFSSEQLIGWRYFFESNRLLFLIIHTLVYLIIYLGWPKFIACLVRVRGVVVDEIILQHAIFARNYLIALLVILEIL